MIERDGHGGRKLPVGIRCTAALRRGVFRFVAAIILAALTNSLVENLHTIRLEAYVFVAPIIDEPKLERYLDLRTSGHCTSAASAPRAKWEVWVKSSSQTTRRWPRARRAYSCVCVLDGHEARRASEGRRVEVVRFLSYVPDAEPTVSTEDLL